jgi:hypothetical protein
MLFFATYYVEERIEKSVFWLIIPNVKSIILLRFC